MGTVIAWVLLALAGIGVGASAWKGAQPQAPSDPPPCSQVNKCGP